MYTANVCVGWKYETLKLSGEVIAYICYYTNTWKIEKNKTKSMNSQKFLILFEIKDNIEHIYVFELGK